MRCWLLSALKGIAIRPPRTCKRSLESRLSPRGAANPNGFMFVGRARAFSARRFTNGPRTQSATVAGLPLIIVSSGNVEKIITLLSGRWLSNGSESPFAAGRIVFPITTRSTFRVSVVTDHR